MGLLLPLCFSLFQLISSRVALKVAPEYKIIVFNKMKRLSFFGCIINSVGEDFTNTIFI